MHILCVPTKKKGFCRQVVALKDACAVAQAETARLDVARSRLEGEASAPTKKNQS